MTEPYFVEAEKEGGCPYCGGGTTWTVIGPDGIACGIIWENREGAEEHAEISNCAYAIGLEAGKGEKAYA